MRELVCRKEPKFHFFLGLGTGIGNGFSIYREGKRTEEGKGGETSVHQR